MPTEPTRSPRGDATPPAARILGYAGLLPNLLALGGMLMLVRQPEAGVYRFGLAMSAQIYAALILSFLGGMWWGVAALKIEPARLWSWLAMAVAPSLVAAGAFASAWIAPPPLGIALVLGAGLILSLAGDARLVRDGMVPGWWMRLRVPLSIGLAAETIATGLLA